MKNNKDKKKILQSICKELGIPNILEVLSTVPKRRLLPILLEAWKKRASRRRPVDLLNEYEEKNQFYGISSFSQERLMTFAQICFSALPKEYSIVETSPITPLGLNSVLSSVSQNVTLSSIRDSEVVSDTTTQLALECALQRRRYLKDISADPAKKSVHLCSSHRILRLQPFDSTKGYMQHFNLLGLCSGGRGSNGKSAGIRWVREQIAILLRMLNKLESCGLNLSETTVCLSDVNFLEQLISVLSIPRSVLNLNSLNDDFDFFKEFKINFPREVEFVSDLSENDFRKCGLTNQVPYMAILEREIFDILRQEFPSVRFVFDFTRKAGLGYYKNICFHIFANTSENKRIQIADGGTVDWLEKLLQNKKEVMVTSGIGSELVDKVFT